MKEEMDDCDHPKTYLPRKKRPCLEDSSDDDKPLSKHLYRKRDRNVSPNRADSANDESLQTTITKAVTCEDSDSDVPLLNRNTRSNGNRLYMPISKMKDRIKSEGDSKEGLHVPLLENARKEGNTENDAPGQSPGSQGQEGDTTGNEWWNEPDKHDGTIKWKTLEHNGVLFPPPYAPLPADVKMKYDGIPITLEPEVEEIACFFGEMLDATHYVENPTFRKNFFEDFQKTIKRTSGARNPQGRVLQIETLAKCDFSSIFEYFQMRKAQRKAEPLAQRKEQKAARDALEEPFRLCIWDGQPQKVGNFRIEPPGLFRGRGDHPRNGKVKTRVSPEQVTLNLSKNANVPLPPVEHQWKDIKHDQEATWLAMWKENVNGNYKYVMLAANSNVRGQSDYKKFETSRRLKQHIDRIRHDYQQGLRHELMKIRQLATAMYLIDKLALRAGNEKGEGEADTVGCCSLKYENVTLKPPNTVVLDFLGKDSIRFYDEVGVDRQVFKNFKIFKKFPKKEGDEIFDRLTTSGLNRHLSNYMPGLTAKVFRTFNASFIFSNLLKTIKPEASVTEKVKAYNDANRTVAILCNHKRAITASHSAQMEKLYDREKAIQYELWRRKKMMLSLDPGVREAMGDGYFERDDCLELDWIKEHQISLVEEKRQKIMKKFEADPTRLQQELEIIKQMELDFQEENETGEVQYESKRVSMESTKKSIDRLQKQLEATRAQAENKESNKEVALGTSKMNYIDPRLSVVFSKKFNVPINKLFSKGLQEKFDWAIKSVDESWEF